VSTDLFGETVVKPAKSPRKPAPDANPAVKHLVDLFHDTHIKRWGYNPDRSGFGRLAKKYKDLLASSWTEEDLAATIRLFFSEDPPHYVWRVNRWNTDAYLRCIDQLYHEIKHPSQHQANGRSAENAQAIARAMRRR